jgi:hypothetical protein
VIARLRLRGVWLRVVLGVQASSAFSRSSHGVDLEEGQMARLVSVVQVGMALMVLVAAVVVLVSQAAQVVRVVTAS